jgi:RimJ/RimL family protein N-acetyltransferase
VVGVVSEGNNASIRVLEKLGMNFERMFAMRPDAPEVRLYGRSLNPGI